MPTISLNPIEFLAVVVISWIVYDIAWTSAFSDARATAHFAKASIKRRLIWVGLTIWALESLITHIMLFV